jgi:hypothetical protein
VVAVLNTSPRNNPGAKASRDAMGSSSRDG